MSDYVVPELIQSHDVDYVVLDLDPNSPTLNSVPKGVEEWFNSCPYYELVYSRGDIRIYQVDTSALP